MFCLPMYIQGEELRASSICCAGEAGRIRRCLSEGFAFESVRRFPSDACAGQDVERCFNVILDNRM